MPSVHSPTTDPVPTTARYARAGSCFGGKRRWSRSRSPERSASAFSAVVARTMAEDMASSSKAWSSYLADEPCAVLLVDRRHVPRADALEERERLLEERGLQVRPLAIVVGVLGGDGLNLPLEAQHVAQRQQAPLKAACRGQ